VGRLQIKVELLNNVQVPAGENLELFVLCDCDEGVLVLDAVQTVDVVDFVALNGLFDEGELEFVSHCEFVHVIPDQNCEHDVLVSELVDDQVLALGVVPDVADFGVLGVEYAHPGPREHVAFGLDELQLVLEFVVHVEHLGREFVVHRLRVNVLVLSRKAIQFVAEVVVENL